MLSRFIKSDKKGSLLASFFLCLLCFISNATSAQEVQSISINDQWKALLHIPNETSLIPDPSFVSQDEEPALSELKKGIKILTSDNTLLKNDYLCRFPARVIWIQKNYPELNSTLSPQENCPEFNEFLLKVPADKIELIYAYENIEYPASMMGHVFLNLKGVNDQGVQVEHAVSFYTDTMTLNFPKLLFDSLILGKKGYFTVSPYQQQLQQYNIKEQRNVIEYELLIDSFNRKLLQYHIWELKDVNLLYYFNSFNCATLTNDLIGITSSLVLSKSSDWITPLDVVKASSDANILGSSTLQASNSWKIRMLKDALKKQGIDAKKYISGNKSVNHLNEDQRFLLFSLEESYINSNANFKNDFNHSKKIKKLRSKWKIENENQYIELSNYKNPLLRANDSQFNISLDDESLFLEYIPTSHQISDDHRSSFSESELQLLSFKGRFSLTNDSADFDEIKLYRMSSFIPYDDFSGGLSKRFSIGWEREYDQDLEETFSAYMSGSAGLSYRLHDDFLFYSLFNMKLESFNGINISYGPEIGFFLYEVFSQKTIFSYSENYNQFKSKEIFKKLEVSQSWFFNKDYSFIINYEKNMVSNNSNEKIGLELRHYY